MYDSLGGSLTLLQSLVPWLKGLPVLGEGVVDGLMTHVLLVDGVVGTGTVVVEVVVVDMVAVGQWVQLL